MIIQTQTLEAETRKLDKMMIEANDLSSDHWWSNTNAMTISAVILCFGVIILLLATYSLRTGRNHEDVLRIYGTILIIVVSVFLVVAGYSNNQIAPVMGLLGTIAGYLLGKEVKTNRDEKE